MLTKDTKLRFWCQKVLPLVYDDSLSYYELLNKVVLHLNQHTEDINELIDFYNDFTDDVEEIIRQMIDDGDFNEIIVDTLGSIVAKEYDPTKSYIIFDYCIFESKLYRANSSTTGVFNPEKWDERTVCYDLTTIQNYIYSLNAGNVSYDNSETYNPNSVGAFIKSLSTIINNVKTTKRITAIDDLATTENTFVTFAEDVSVGGIIFPQFAKGILVTNMADDASLYAIGMDGKLYTAFRTNIGWRYGRAVTNEINDLNDAINALTPLPTKVLFIGDDYGKLNTPNWCTYLADLLGVTSANYSNQCTNNTGFTRLSNGNAGNGFLVQLQAPTNKETYTHIFCCGGINDSTVSENPSVESNIATFISYYKANYPNAKLYIGYIGGALSTSSILQDRTTRQQTIAKAHYINAAKGYYLNGVENAIHTTPASYLPDGLHPTTSASERIAKAIYQAYIRGYTEIKTRDTTPYTPPEGFQVAGSLPPVLEVKDDFAILTLYADTGVGSGTSGNVIANASHNKGFVLTFSNIFFNTKVTQYQTLESRQNRTSASDPRITTLQLFRLAFEGYTLTITPESIGSNGTWESNYFIDSVIFPVDIQLCFPTSIIN